MRVAGSNLLARLGRRTAQLVTYAAWPANRVLTQRADPAAPLRPPPIFIVGAPRSGSTVLYQLMANQWDVMYVSNLAALFYHSLAVGLRVHAAVIGDRPFNRFDSVHGRTPGLEGPSECGRCWHRWFPRDRDFVAAGEIPADAVHDLRRTFIAIATAHRRPLLIKNLNCGQRLQVLRQALPEALIIVCRREPVANAVSILNGRLDATGSRERWWSVRPRHMHDIRSRPYWEQVVHQVHALEEQTWHDLQDWPAEQWTTMQYDALCNDPAGELARLRAFLATGGASLDGRRGAELPSLRAGDPRTRDPDDLSRVRDAVAALQWLP